MKNCIVIGGGIIGLSTAYFLQKEGHQVTVIDKSDFSSGASYVNAGYITPSHIISLASPGIITKGIKWMLNASSPFYVKPRWDIDFFKWTWSFKKSATAKKVEAAIPVIKDINLLSRELYEELKASEIFNFHYQRNGLLMYYKTDKVGETEWKIGQRALEEGLEAELLSLEMLKKIEPNVFLDVKGAIYYPCDGHMTPNQFMPQLQEYLKNKNVQFIQNESVTDLVLSNKKIHKIITTHQELKADEYILASGSWTTKLAKKIGLNIPIQAGKGYRIDLLRETKITTPSILCEAKVAVTPMNGFTRFAGTMELGGINHKVNPIRVKAIAKAAENYYPELHISDNEKELAACGLRPCSPDGLPFIGKSSKCNNLTIATGHAMMGWSLGPATGKLVSEIISGKQLSMDITPFHPDRKF